MLKFVKTPSAMRFSPRPNESLSQIRKAGKILKNYEAATPHDYFWAIDLTGRWRACHAYPINTFQSTLRSTLKIGNFKEFIVAQRLKRLPTIIKKLREYHEMQLITMQDIGGVRAILRSVKDVYKIRDHYMKSKYFAGMDVREKNYIDEPRDADGYRSIHLIFNYQNKKYPGWNGLKLEMQIRTKLQHAWATAVETMSTILGQDLKAKKGERKWLDFFALTSSAFSHIEGCEVVPRYKHLTKVQTFKLVAKAERELGALEIMKNISIAIDQIHIKQAKASSYFLVVLDSVKKSVQVDAFNRDGIKEATLAYAKYEARAAHGESIEPVLVSAGSIESLKRAYPNLFLDSSEFSKMIEYIIVKAG